ncbi:MAG: sulfatase-like hydrolase/transferase, partial [Verrucomicrobiota bacterium]
IDRLARAGVRFTQAYGHTQCSPARAMLLTGRHPQRSGVNGFMQRFAEGAEGSNLSPATLTLPDILKQHGWRTGLFGKWNLGASRKSRPLKHGYDRFFGFLGEHIHNLNHHYLAGRGFHDLYDDHRKVSQKNKYFPDLMTDRALEFIEKNKEQPFFVQFAFNLPHHPEISDPQFDERYKDLPMPRQSYAKMVSTLDHQLGRVFEHLRAHNLLGNTILIFTGDNGYSTERNAINTDRHKSRLPKGTNFGANGGGGNTGSWIGAKGKFTDGGIRVPAIIAYPARIPKNDVRDQAIMLTDWLPTILDLCGLPQPGIELDGSSLLPILLDAEAPTHHKVMHWQFQNIWAVREGSWKLIGK